MSDLRAAVHNPRGAEGGRQNTSDAVMAQRGIDLDALDDFPTPPWATRAFITKVVNINFGETALEPAAGRGYMSEVLKEGFGPNHVDSYDIEDYGYCPALPGGFLENAMFDGHNQWDWVITNPPFKYAREFVERALGCARRGVAMLCRTAIIEGQSRYEHLYAATPPSLIAQYVERVPMVEAQFDPKASTATGYCWLVWDRAVTHPLRSGYPNQLVQTPLCWIPPCRFELEKPWERINALLIVSVNERNRGKSLYLDTTAAGIAQRAKHEEKSRDRFATAVKELHALTLSPEWHTVRPLLRDVDGSMLSQDRIRGILSTINATA